MHYNLSSLEMIYHMVLRSRRRTPDNQWRSYSCMISCDHLLGTNFEAHGMSKKCIVCTIYRYILMKCSKPQA